MSTLMRWINFNSNFKAVRPWIYSSDPLLLLWFLWGLQKVSLLFCLMLPPKQEEHSFISKIYKLRPRSPLTRVVLKWRRVWKIGGKIVIGNRSTRRETCSSATIFTPNITDCTVTEAGPQRWAADETCV